MSRICCLALLLATVAVSLLLGCGQQTSGDNTASTPNLAMAPGPKGNQGGGAGDKGVPVDGGDQANAWQQANFSQPDADQEKYDAALLEAIDLLSQKRYIEALAWMEAASKFRDTELVQTEMKKLRLRIEQQQAAERTLQDIQMLFDQGQIAEAGQLASDALNEYGSTDAAPELVKLKLQADALAVAGIKLDGDRHKAFRDQGQAAEKAGNLRAAALAYEQALQFGDDAQLRKTSDEIRGRLAKYDGNRQQAAELRKDPAKLDDALELLNDAAKVWDTPQIRQDIDECNLAMQNRRDRIAIADFEVRGDVGIPMADRAIAEELLPYFKGRFDVVERSQIAKVVEELKLEAGKLGGSDEDQRELGRLARVRYLVLGSVSRIGGFSVNARLVDVSTGLIVQTAKISAASPEDLLANLPELAKLLLMSDQDRLVYELELAKQAPPVPQVQIDQPLPPPPELPQEVQPLPPSEVINTSRPPNLGGVKVEDFQQFQPQPAAQPLPPIVYGGEPEEVWKRKALYVSVDAGDMLFRRGRYVEATRRFEFGLTLAPGFFDLDLRISRTRPWLPPPPVIIVVPPPPPPRIAIIDFVVVGNPALVPPGLGWWTPSSLAPYFSPPYEVVDRGELYWWMNRMGMSVRDLMVDPYARRWLGRALNVRYFVFGTITQTASFNVDTYMVDAENGYLNGRGFVHVNNQHELRYRIGELARATQTPPGLWKQQQQDYGNYEGLIVKANLATNRGDINIAIGFLRDALRIRPRSVEVLVYLERLERLGRQRDLDALRRKEFERQQLLALERTRRQQELAREAERQRILAVQAHAALSEQQRLLQENQRLAAQLAAYNQLLLQARNARKAGNVQVSITTFESALRLRQSDDVFRELAAARAELNNVNKLRELEEARLREVKLQRQKEEELAKARARLDAERKLREAEETALRKAQEARDNAEYQRLIDQGQKQMANAQFNPAISSFQAARRLKKTDAVEALLNSAMLAQTRAVADAKGASARQQLEQQLAEEKERRVKAEAEAKVNQGKYLAFLNIAQKAQAGRDYTTAIANYNEAGRIFKTDVVLTGLAQSQAAADKAKADAIAVKEKQTAEQNKQATFQALMNDGQAALTAKDYAKAVDKFGAARKLNPSSIDAMAALTKAEQARDQAGLEGRNKAQQEERIKTFNRLLKDGQDNLARKQFDAAVANLTEALKLNPGDPAATKALKLAQDAHAGTVKTADQVGEAKKKADAYQKAMTDGRLALQNKQFDAAIQAFSQAQKVLPGDVAAQNFLKDAQKQKDDARAVEIAAATKKADDLQRQIALQKVLGEARSALAAKNLATAQKSLAAAIKLSPTDPAVEQLQKDLQKAENAASADAAAQQKRKAQFDLLMATGKKALDAKQFDAAIKALSEANALLPGDKTNQDWLTSARQQQQQAAKVAGDQAAKKTAYEQAIKQGKDLLAAKQFDPAIKQFQLANSYQPGDATAAGLIKEAEQARNAAAADQQRLAEFNRLMKEGNSLLGAKKFAEAVASFTAANKLMPNDQNAAKALQNANQQWTASKTPAGPTAKTPVGPTGKGPAGPTGKGPAGPTGKGMAGPTGKGPAGPTAAEVAEYNRQMGLGAGFDKQKKWDDAIKAYDAALKQIPKDAKASEAKKKATYNDHMTEGNRLYSTRKFVEAVREYEAALRLYPKDAEATAALKKAKDAK